MPAGEIGKEFCNLGANWESVPILLIRKLINKTAKFVSTAASAMNCGGMNPLVGRSFSVVPLASRIRPMMPPDWLSPGGGVTTSRALALMSVPGSRH